jgi:hypothetical protein
MICDTLTNPVCLLLQASRLLVPSVATSAAGDVLSGIANAISDGVRWIVVNTATWWVQIPSPDLTAEPAITQIQAWLLPVTAAVAAGGVIAAGVRMALTRRASPLLDVTGGLLTLAAVATLGVAVPALLLKAGDAWSAWILQVSTGGQFTQRLTTALELGGGAAPAVVLVFGIIAIVLSLVQAVLMLFRQAALVILAGVLPLAAAGSVAPLTRTWVRKVTSWMLALICYKPAAAAVYAAAFTMIGSGGSTRTMLMGFVMLLLSLVTLPALMKFFTWTTGSIAQTGGGGQLLGAAAVGAVAVSAMRSAPGGGSGGPAQDQASYLSTRLGSPPGGGPPGAASGPASSASLSGPPSSPGSAATAASAPATQPATGATSSAPAGATASTAPGAATSTTAAGPTPAGAAPSGASTTRSAGAASTGAASTTAATGAAATAGPAGAVAAGSAQAAQAAARLASGAMKPEEDSP